ncbi:MAG: VWA domain-containing protein [Candidatus Lokiarchaeota archaeon]|nr:VWA domain-containing protein [Candidatus Lokiarchaeota archaeon]MBD3201388.1 VWA domain-containing protein [Candidatus Lokiarchaeota archaeon]
MFVDFFYYLRERLPVSITEYMTLIEALDMGLVNNMVEFYYISRSIFCKNEHEFDVYDISFANYFKDANLKFPEDIKKEIWDWLEKPLNKEEMNREFQDFMDMHFDIEELQRQFEELMNKQDEEHNFGNQWIGTGGDSQFGHSGQNPMGMRVGGGTGMRMAIQIAQKRVFRDYRKDVVLDTRQIKVALKRLRKLEEIGKQDELNLDKTIDKTAKNGGDIELIFEKRRKNNVKMLLLMDVGGSMTPYSHLVNKLFSAANNMSHWKDFKYYYFHNCIYEKIYENAQRNPDEALDFDEFLKKYDKNYKVVIVGDAAMASWELTERYGSIYYYHRNEMPGIYYLKEISSHFSKNCVWLNPEIIRFEWLPWTRKVISSIFPMYNLTIDGIEEAMDYLRKGGRHMYTTLDRLKNLKY